MRKQLNTRKPTENPSVSFHFILAFVNMRTQLKCKIGDGTQMPGLHCIKDRTNLHVNADQGLTLGAFSPAG